MAYWEMFTECGLGLAVVAFIASVAAVDMVRVANVLLDAAARVTAVAH
jgi:hypothetical protein